MVAIQKLTLIGGSAGLVSATAGGVAIYLNSGESIKDHIIKQSASNRKFISLVSEAHNSLISKYSKAGNHKPTENKKQVPSEKIVEWCEKSANAKFSSEEDDIYLSVDTWCFVDITVFSEKAKQSGKKDIVGENGKAEGWKTAWNTYNTQKKTSKLEISASSTSKLNTTNSKDEGGEALYEWCSNQKDKHMYEVDSENIYSRYEKWCFQQ